MHSRTQKNIRRNTLNVLEMKSKSHEDYGKISYFGKLGNVKAL